MGAKPRVVLADDDADVLSLMKELLLGEGFEVTEAADGQQALTAVRACGPDLAVFDYQMPNLDGLEVCRILRNDPAFMHLPMIILSSQASRDNRVKGLNLGVDDFIAKPVDTQEFLARVRRIMGRIRSGLDANPLTRLPGNNAIQARIEQALSERGPLAVLYIDLNHFKQYNDVYGYEAGDRIIAATARLLLQAARRETGPTDFVGHIGGDDFIVVSTPERMDEVARCIIREFDAMVPSFYSEEDRERGFVMVADRQGQIQKTPLLSVAVAISHNALHPLTSYAEIAAYGSELKKVAKRAEGSRYVIDRRSRVGADQRKAP